MFVGLDVGAINRADQPRNESLAWLAEAHRATPSA
jgi:hypothetical protein